MSAPNLANKPNRDANMSNKHTATLMGQTFKRTSLNRSYSHAVVLVESVAKQRAKLAASLAKYGPYKGSTVEADLAAFDLRMLTHPRLVNDGLSTVGVVGWCGRMDLAQKLAARYAKHGYTAVIVDAQVQS